MTPPVKSGGEGTVKFMANERQKWSGLSKDRTVMSKDHDNNIFVIIQLFVYWFSKDIKNENVFFLRQCLDKVKKSLVEKRPGKLHQREASLMAMLPFNTVIS